MPVHESQFAHDVSEESRIRVLDADGRLISKFECGCGLRHKESTTIPERCEDHGAPFVTTLVEMAIPFRSRPSLVLRSE